MGLAREAEARHGYGAVAGGAAVNPVLHMPSRPQCSTRFLVWLFLMSLPSKAQGYFTLDDSLS